MRKQTALLGSALFFIVAPGAAVGLLPWLISRWVMLPPFFAAPSVRWLGVSLIALGLLPIIDSFRRFALEGLGTPAPVAAPTLLIVTGFYRHVRNPMYVGVVAMVVGQALLFANVALLVYAAVLWVVFHLFVTAYEEPALRRQFGADYEAFARHVPRWIPRLTPWRG